MKRTLKERREKLGFSLHEIALKTRIRVSFLKAIEEGIYDELPGDVYARGYIKDYARFLGVPPEQEIASYEEHLAKKTIVQAAEDMKAQPQADRAKTLRMPLRMPAISFPRRLIWVMPAVLVLLVAVALVQYRYGGNAGVPEKPSREARVSEPARTGESVDQQGGGPVQQKPPSETLVASERETRKEGHNLDILATDVVWLQVVIDNADTREMQLHAGERVSLSAKESFTLKIGNAGGVKLKFDGRDFENLGQKGQVIRLHLPEAVPQGLTTGQNRSIITPAEASSQPTQRQH